MGDYIFDEIRDMARQLECDDDEAAFVERVKRIVKAPKPAEKPPAPKGERSSRACVSASSRPARLNAAPVSICGMAGFVPCNVQR
jgi:hypothetical protein